MSHLLIVHRPPAATLPCAASTILQEIYCLTSQISPISTFADITVGDMMELLLASEILRTLPVDTFLCWTPLSSTLRPGVFVGIMLEKYLHFRGL